MTTETLPTLEDDLKAVTEAFLKGRPVPVPGGWGQMGATHIRLSVANETQLIEALHNAWKLRFDKNQKSG